MPRSTSRRTVVAAAVAAPIVASFGRTAAQEATPAASDHEAIARAFYVPFFTGDTSIYDQILAEDWVDHPMAAGQVPGRAGMDGVIATFRAVFPDLSGTNEDVLVAGDKVTVRSTVRGTQQGPFLGIPPTGNQVEFMTIDIHRIENGKIVETWHLEDLLGVVFQLGATITPPAPATPTA